MEFRHPHDAGKVQNHHSSETRLHFKIHTTWERGIEHEISFFFLEKFFSQTSALRDKKIKHEIFFLRKIVLANIRTMRGNIYICNYI